uniref:Uncharacterized protein n=1 Tax=Timema poppense TaxID=170557 RepID=A0A7R9H2B6_TIMPO|nr:unnamed protein product [Timema poppensis]
MSSLVLTDSSQLTFDSQHLGRRRMLVKPPSLPFCAGAENLKKKNTIKQASLATWSKALLLKNGNGEIVVRFRLSVLKGYKY